jgi:hypothetical protein
MVENLQQAIYTLVVKFVERQSIVLEAMRDLRPDIIMRVESKGNSELQAELKKKFAQDPGRGQWGQNNEWEYRLHGIGCHLTHTLTGEIIGWDLGSLKRFDPQWFVDYVEWLLNHDTSDAVKMVKGGLKEYPANRDELSRFVFPILDELAAQGLLKAVKHRYTLLST